MVRRCRCRAAVKVPRCCHTCGPAPAAPAATRVLARLPACTCVAAHRPRSAALDRAGFAAAVLTLAAAPRVWQRSHERSWATISPAAGSFGTPCDRCAPFWVAAAAGRLAQKGAACGAGPKAASLGGALAWRWRLTPGAIAAPRRTRAREAAGRLRGATLLPAGFHSTAIRRRFCLHIVSRRA